MDGRINVCFSLNFHSLDLIPQSIETMLTDYSFFFPFCLVVSMAIRLIIQMKCQSKEHTHLGVREHYTAHSKHFSLPLKPNVLERRWLHRFSSM